MFFVFLLLFSYVILCEFYPIEQENDDGEKIGRKIRWPEIALIFWVLMFGVDEIRQVLPFFYF